MTIPGIYSQRDPRWSNNELGYNNDPYYNMYHFGCLVTAVSNAMWYAGYGPDPASVNTWLQAKNGFEAGGGNLIWEKAHQLMAQANLQYVRYSTDLNDVNNFLAGEDNFAICQLKKPGFPMHFSTAPFVGLIADSWDAVLKPITSYTFVGAHLYSKVIIPAVVESTPAPAAPTIVAPQPAAAPQPVPSVETPIADPTPAAPVVQTDPLIPYGFSLDQKQLTIQRTGAYALDIVTGEKVRDIANGTTLESSGSFTYAAQTYYRTKWSYDNLSATVIPGVFFEAPTGQPDGPVPTRVTTPVLTDPAPEAGPVVAAQPFWDQFKASPLGALIRLILNHFR